VTASTAAVPYRGGTVDIEYAWLRPGQRGAALVVFLHEGLGSVSTWRDFPAQLCAARGFRGLVYSRPGYGCSTPRPPDDRWSPDFMHEQARELLPALLRSLDIDGDAEPPWLLGHSDGGSIALIHAASFPRRAAGLVLLAPHVFVEDVTIACIEAARTAYLTSDLRERLLRHHDDPDSAFWGWNDVWLDPAFRGWSIESLLPSIRCPLLVVQGRDDEYGTLAQIEAVADAAPQAELLTLDACGHSPHRDQPERLTRAVLEFVTRYARSTSSHADQCRAQIRDQRHQQQRAQADRHSGELQEATRQGAEQVPTEGRAGLLPLAKRGGEAEAGEEDRSADEQQRRAQARGRRGAE
jgi:pimeloyl-ACP methyl ester carboxylesterase